MHTFGPKTLIVLAFALTLPTLTWAVNAACPPYSSSRDDAPSKVSVHGQVVFHNVTRGWLGLHVDPAVCGHHEIGLAFSTTDAWMQAKALRGCSVTVMGRLSPSLTAYYATSINFFNAKIVPDTTCSRHPWEENPYRYRVSEAVRAYKATVWIDTADQRPLSGEAIDAGTGKRLEGPWRAYANPDLNEEEDLDMSCHTGFRLTCFSGSLGSQTVELYPGTARLSAPQMGTERLSITCRRNTGGGDPSRK